MTQKLSLYFSPCPNDTFIFDALINKKIDTEGLDFEPVLEDVQTLNEWARQGKPDVSKISYGALLSVLDKYTLLNSGGALGEGVGPLLISSKPHADNTSSTEKGFVNNQLIAIPGENTTANFLFSMAYPDALNKVYLKFDQIENFVASGKGLGVIIHENRFTYQQKGLFLVQDLGDYWERETGNPIPLGGIVVRKSLEKSIQQKVDRLIRKSLEYSFSHYPEISDYVKSNAQEMDPDVMLQHINLYVNNFSLDLGEKGRQAVQLMLRTLGGQEIDDKDVFL